MAASSRRPRRHRSGLTLILFALYISTSSPSAQTRPAFTVLAFEVSADSPGRAADNLTWYTTLREALQSQLHRSVDMFLEYVPRTEDASLAFRDYIRQRYRDQRPDLIVASAASEHQFVLRYRDELFPDTPIVIGVGWGPDESIRRAGAGLAAVEFVGAIRETLALALRLHPATKQVHVLVGRSPRFVPQLRAELQPIAGQVPLNFVADLSVPDMIETVRNVPADSVIFYLNYVQEVRGQTLSELQVAEMVANASPAPVYGFMEMYIGSGVVGGAMLTPRQEATQLATLAARVLNDERAGDIPVERLKLVPTFDWRQLRRWTIDESALPADADIRFRELTIWERYRWLILGTLALMALQTALIVGLVAQRARRREMQEALHESQERYALATSDGRVGVWDWDVETKTIYVDPALRTLLGYPRDAREPLDDWLQLVHPEDRAVVIDRMRDHAAGKSAFYEVEHRMVHRDGAVFWVLVRGTVAARAGQPTRVVGTITDTTDRKRTEQKLQEMQGELARIARLNALGEFAASIAHEVRQPLTAIISSARASLRFLSSGATGEAQEALSYVLEASKRADAVIERNRELFRNRTVQKELLDTNTVVVEAATMARPKLESSQIALVTALAEHLPKIEGDRIELQQVLFNLIVNAIDAMDTLDPALRRLDISTALSPSGAVQVSVSDKGIGLAAVDMERLFTLSYTTKATGTGVGLSISRSIIEAHGGQLWAEPRTSRGATFTFTVPVASSSAGREPVAS